MDADWLPVNTRSLIYEKVFTNYFKYHLVTNQLQFVLNFT